MGTWFGLSWGSTLWRYLDFIVGLSLFLVPSCLYQEWAYHSCSRGLWRKQAFVYSHSGWFSSQEPLAPPGSLLEMQNTSPTPDFQNQSQYFNKIPGGSFAVRI